MHWKLNSSNGRGQPVNYNLGNISNNLQVSFNYDAQGRVSGITTGQKKQTLAFDPASGNLMSRDYRIVNDQTGLTEVFDYDELNRLVKAKVISGDSIVVNYAANGNITGKTNAGSYTYDPSKINAVTSVTGNPATINHVLQAIDYNTYNLTTKITEGDSIYKILYNPLNQRIKTTFSSDSDATVTTTYYSGSYEKKIVGGVTREIHYISSPFGLVAIIVKQGETVQTYFVETDHLGSIIGLINPDKTYAEAASFDPWGRRRNPADWSYENVPAPHITDRGFTGHEHLDAFGLINMNGRMYDPVLGRFLGVDPVIQDGTGSQSYNGYSYCLNNPLKYTDPSGYEMSTLVDELGYVIGAEDDGDNNIYIASSEFDVFIWRYMRQRRYKLGIVGFTADPGAFVGYLGVDINSNQGHAIITRHGGGVIIDDVSKSIIWDSGPNCLNFDKIIAFLNKNAYPNYDPETCGYCATAIVKALKEGGANSTLYQRYAKDNLRYFESLRFHVVKGVDLNNFSFQEGDVAIIMPPTNKVEGHNQMWNGSQWVSDWKQGSGFWPGEGYKKDKPRFIILRY